MSTVSIIIPFYNEEEVLPRCLDSVLGQTYRDIEVILADGASTDRSGAIADAYADRDKRVRVVHQAKRNGISGGRNDALAVATGSLVQFVDADDKLNPEMTELLVRDMRDGCDMVASGFDFITVRGDRVRKETYLPEIEGEMPAQRFVAHCLDNRKMWPSLVGALWCKLFRMDIIRRHGIVFEKLEWEDFLFVVQYLEHGRDVFSRARAYYEYINVEGTDQAITANRYYPNMTRSIMTVTREFERVFANRLPENELGPCLGSLASLLLGHCVSLCRRDATLSRAEIFGRLAEISTSSDAQRWLKWYVPRPGQSRAIPFLLRRGWLRPLFWLCRKKADKRYGMYYRAEF